MSGDDIFACSLDDRDLVRACAPPQPDLIEVGQNWFRLDDGTTLPVKRLRSDIVDLGSEFFTLILSRQQLRLEWVCIDPLKNVTLIRSPTPPAGAADRDDT
jgi:hypothetical protein